MNLIDAIGWIATAVFAASYFFKEPMALRRVQAVAAILWIAYGVLMKAPPVIVANVIVAGLALGSTLSGGGCVAPPRPPRSLRPSDARASARSLG